MDALVTSCICRLQECARTVFISPRSFPWKSPATQCSSAPQSSQPTRPGHDHGSVCVEDRRVSHRCLALRDLPCATPFVTPIASPRNVAFRESGYFRHIGPDLCGEQSARLRAPIAGLVLGYHRIVPGPDSSAVAGVPAPDPIHLIQSFANTLNADSDADLLSTREQAADWLRGAALLPGGAGLTGSDHGALLRLRDALRDVLAAHTAGREDAATAARLTKALADGRLVLTVDSASTVRLASAARASYSGLVAAVAVAIASTAASGTWLRLKSCSDPRCGQAFLDGSATASARHCPAHAEPTE